MPPTEKLQEPARPVADVSPRGDEASLDRAPDVGQGLAAARPAKLQRDARTLMRLQRLAGNAAVESLLAPLLASQESGQASAPVQRSPASEALELTMKTGGKGPFFEQLRHLAAPDGDVRNLWRQACAATTCGWLAIYSIMAWKRDGRSTFGWRGR